MGFVDRNVLLHGRAAPLDDWRLLHAGPVTALLDGIDLRYVSVGRVEIVRRVYAAVRDKDWNTVAAEVSDLVIDSARESFDVSFQARHQSRGIDFTWTGEIVGDRDGRITYRFDGHAETAMQHNRIGLCVHHPWRETPGARFRARTPSGEVVGVFPDLIAPQRLEGGVYQPLFPAFDRLEVEFGNGPTTFEFDGALWEIEDHRNWTDSNFKFYSTPLALPKPHDLQRGARITQRVTITASAMKAVPADEDAVRLSIGLPSGSTVPSVGLGWSIQQSPPSPSAMQRLMELHPAHIRVELHLDAETWPATLADAQAAASTLACPLETSLHLRQEHEAALPDVAAALRSGPPVTRILVILAGARTGTPGETTPAELVDAVRAALSDRLPDTAFLGGTEMYFSELNRTRPRAATWDGVCFSITPQSHAFADADVMENLDAQAENVRSALAINDVRAVVVSPVTLRRRVNFYAVAPPSSSARGLPDSVDVRQLSLFGAAWTAGSLKYLSEAGVSAVTYYEAVGWRGLVEREEGSSLPNLFPSRPGQTFPLYHPLADAAGWNGAEVLRCESTEPLAAIGFCVRTADGLLRLLLANLSPRERQITVHPLIGRFRLRRLNETNADAATTNPTMFRRSSMEFDTKDDLALRLLPYEVVRVDSIVPVGH